MLPLFQHTTTRELFVMHYASAGDRRRAKRHAGLVAMLQAANPTIDITKIPERDVDRNRVAVRYQSAAKRKPREQAWAEYKKSGTRY